MSERKIVLPQDPKCPKCGRGYCERFYPPNAKRHSLRCVGRENDGCGHQWQP
jgi:hypothetical protein